MTEAKKTNPQLKFVQSQVLQQTLKLLGVAPSCGTETGKKELSERSHVCSNCGYTTDRDVAPAQVVLVRGLAVVGHTVKMLSEGKFIGIPVKKESPAF